MLQIAYSNRKCLTIFFVRCLATFLVNVNAFFQTTHHNRWNCCRPATIQNFQHKSTSQSTLSVELPLTSSSLFEKPPWLPQHEYYEDDSYLHQQTNFQEWHQAEVIEPHAWHWTQPQQQPLESIVSYGTGGNSFAEPIRQPELSVGRRNGMTQYSSQGGNSFAEPIRQPELSVGRRNGMTQYSSPSGRRKLQPASESKPNFHRFIGDNSGSSYFFSRIPQKMKPAIISPELTVGRTRHNGYNLSHQQESKYSVLPYGSGAYSFSQPIGPSPLTAGRSRIRSRGARSQKSTFESQIVDNVNNFVGLQSYGTGTYSFSQPLDPPI